MAIKPRPLARRVQSQLYRSSLFALIILIGLSLLAGLYDMAQQFVRGNRITKNADTAIVAGAYVLTGVMAFFISISRLISMKRSVASIPKPYVPIQREDVPKKVHELISTEYSRSALAFHMSQPHGRSLPGWGRAGTPYEGMRFRAAILDSVKTLRIAIKTIHPGLLDKELPRSAYSLHSSLLTPLLPGLFDPPNAVLYSTHRPIVQFWDERLERARWQKEEPTQEEFEEVVRATALILDRLAKPIEVEEKAEKESKASSLSDLSVH